jgi:hypothetical protein
MTPEIALQTAVRLRLTGTAQITALVPAANILDRNVYPIVDPSIIIGEGVSRDDDGAIARNRTAIFMDLHIWKEEPSTAGVKLVAGLIRAAIKGERLALENSFHCIDARVSNARFLRDPDGVTSHAVVTIDALVEEQT